MAASPATTFRDRAQAAGLTPSQIVLEITERSEARLSQVVADATRLRSLGFRLALDDVGAGNAGLEMLRELPVDFVKIDRAVIAAAIDDASAQAVTLAIIAYDVYRRIRHRRGDRIGTDTHVRPKRGGARRRHPAHQSEVGRDISWDGPPLTSRRKKPRRQ